MKNATNMPLAVITSGDVTQIPEEKREAILSIKKNMDITTYDGTFNFASEASNNLKDFSTSILQNIKVKDVPEVDSLLSELMTSLNRVDADTLMTTKQSFFRRLFKVDEMKSFISKYDDISSAMVDVKNKLISAQFQLQKDIEMCEQYYDQNRSYISDLDNFICAGHIKSNEVAMELEQLRNVVDSNDALQTAELNKMQGALDRLNRKIYNLEILRDTASQNALQIQIIQQGDAVLVETIQSSIDNAIPLWESQIVIAIALEKQKSGLDMQTAVTAAIEQMMTNNSNLLKLNAIDIAKKLEDGVISIETIKTCNQNLIETLEGIRKVRAEGNQKRLNAEKVLIENQEKLNKAVIGQTNVSMEKFIS